MDQRIYMAIDLKSFYASVECVERNLNPLTTNLVVADQSRTEKTICLAVTPSLKQYGISGRGRLFEVIQKVKEINEQRERCAPNHQFVGESFDDEELKERKDLSLTYIVAPPRMSFYMEYSTKIYEIYLKYVSPEDIHVYSIDEVFMDVTSYLNTYHMSPKEIASKIILDVLASTGITATAGIGTNLYLCKVAMDIVAKHVKPDANGVRIALLDEARYRKLLWNHKPITDFWRVGRGIAKRLEQVGIYTMGDIAKCSVGTSDGYYQEDLLYDMLGINAELLIDHAWGYESCTMKEIKAYRPSQHSIGTAQVLSCPYTFEQAKLIVTEMLDQLALDLVDKQLVSDQIILSVGYDIENLTTSFHGEVTTDRYGRKIPKHAHGSANLGRYTSSSRWMRKEALALYDRIVNRELSIKRIAISANHVIYEEEAVQKQVLEQFDLFTNYEEIERQKELEEQELKREKQLQKVTLSIKKKYGKNALLKGMNFEEGATARERNEMIGGHKG